MFARECSTLALQSVPRTILDWANFGHRGGTILQVPVPSKMEKMNMIGEQ
jgi:hypothetical protein